MKNSSLLILLMLLILAAAGWWAFSSSAPESELPDQHDSAASGTQPADAMMDATTTNFSNQSGTDTVSLTFTADRALLTGLGFADVMLLRVPAASGARYESTDPPLTVWNQGDELTIYENEEVVFTGTSEPSATDIPAALTDVSWVWTETIMSNGDTITPDQPDAFTLTFNTDGQLNGTTDCNTFRGQYKVVDSSFDVGPLAMTRMACPDSQEQEFTHMIDEANSVYFAEDSQLVLLLPVDSGSIIFKPLSE